MTMDDLKAEMLIILGSGANWCKRSNARDSLENPCPIGAETAVKWDIFGALLKAHWNLQATDFKAYHDQYERMKANIPQDYKNRDIESFNDDTDWNGILKLLGEDSTTTPKRVRGTVSGEVRALEDDTVRGMEMG